MEGKTQTKHTLETSTITGSWRDYSFTIYPQDGKWRYRIVVGLNTYEGREQPFYGVERAVSQAIEDIEAIEARLTAVLTDEYQETAVRA